MWCVSLVQTYFLNTKTLPILGFRQEDTNVQTHRVFVRTRGHKCGICASDTRRRQKSVVWNEPLATYGVIHKYECTRLSNCLAGHGYSVAAVWSQKYPCKCPRCASALPTRDTQLFGAVVTNANTLVCDPTAPISRCGRNGNLARFRHVDVQCKELSVDQKR